MAFTTASLHPDPLLSLPASHNDFIPYLVSNPQVPIHTLLEPYKEFEAKLRHLFAQQPHHPALNEPSIVPVFGGHEKDIKVRARDPDSESDNERQRYIMPLGRDDRRPNGSPGVVQSLKEFQRNFAVFSESSLSEMDWSNVVVAGSAALTPLLPVPDAYAANKRSLRQYYHESIAPASDVDLFLYGLTDEQAKEKIKQIEQHVRDSVLSETTTVRTKNAITIVSEYPTRHVQIVLRVYRSISEMLTGFDVDCSCVAYDGKQVWASPRALAACITQTNQIDLTRRSPSYENRLAKYARRGFEVYWPFLERNRINPTIFERSFQRVVGLARLLVLEKLPEKSDREAYADQRRSERGRPPVDRHNTRQREYHGDIKAEHEYEIAEWMCEDDVSDYHTFTIPYGRKYHARKIEKLLYKKDLLLNAEWNKPKDRDVNLHRHPAFFGNAEDVMNDCCGFCPEPQTPEDNEVAEEESKRFVTGTVSFLKDDPGRQTIGSFNPITDTEWTEMAYIANTESLCNAIVNQDLTQVQYWLGQDGVDPNHRDWTGRTLLHLAVISSTPQIVQCIIDSGARIVARMADGKTALHLAAMHGSTEKVSALLRRSEANEEVEARKHVRHTQALKIQAPEEAKAVQDESELDVIDCSGEDDNYVDTTTQGSYVKVEPSKDNQNIDLPEEAEEDEPDIYDVNVCAWDVPVSALHLAILNGHVDVVKLMVNDFGANVLLPVKLTGWNKSPRASILPLVMALMLPHTEAKRMTEVLLDLGCSAAQADFHSVTALHHFAAETPDLLDCLLTADKPGASRALNHPVITGSHYRSQVATPLTTSILKGDQVSAVRLLEAGVQTEIDHTSYLKAWRQCFGDSPYHERLADKEFQKHCDSPIMLAVKHELPSLVLSLLGRGAEINFTLSWEEGHGINARLTSESVLDTVRAKIKSLKQYLDGANTEVIHDAGPDDFVNMAHKLTLVQEPPIIQSKDAATCLDGLVPESYAHWSLQRQLGHIEVYSERVMEEYQRSKTFFGPNQGSTEKDAAVRSLLQQYVVLETQLLDRGAKTFLELHETEAVISSNKTQVHLPVTKQAKQFSPRLTFRTPDSTDEREEAYQTLFQACWTGDTGTIRRLTTGVWNENNAPLKIAVVDRNGFSTLDIAVFQGRLDVAKLILDIALEQHNFKEQASKNRLMKTVVGSDGRDSDDDESDDDAINILTENVDDRFTIEDIGVVSAQAQGDISPLDLLNRNCPASHFVDKLASVTKAGIKRRIYPSLSSQLFGTEFEDSFKYQGTHWKGGRLIQLPDNLFKYAIFNDNAHLLSFLLDMGTLYSNHHTEKEGESVPQAFQFSESDLHFAISLGRTRILEEIMTRTGAGLPLDMLVKKTGAKPMIDEKPKYYQGLSVRGKKRTDWAKAGRESQVAQPQGTVSLLLLAAKNGNLESVKLYMSEAPQRCYAAFVSANKNDPRVTLLKESVGGAAKAIDDWLSSDRHLLAHCAILGHPEAATLEVLRYIIESNPSVIHQKARNGQTPLHLAFALNRQDEKEDTKRLDMIKLLIEAGSDQTTRDKAGNNVVHSLLHKKGAANLLPADKIRQILSLLDSDVLTQLLVQKSTESPGSVTPLALCLHAGLHSDLDEIVSTVLSFSKGAELEVINGEGDTPVHTEVRRGHSDTVQAMLACRPDLLWRENAVGRTPYEVARDVYTAHMLSEPPTVPGVQRTSRGSNSRSRFVPINVTRQLVLQKPPAEFVHPPQPPKSNAERTWEVCARFERREGLKKRKLVSLLEANEVAKRLASEKRKRGKMNNGNDKGDEAGDVFTDLVDHWTSH